MKPWNLLRPKTGKEIPFLILISFLATFALSRFVTSLPFPNLYLKVRDIHVHHFAYGIFILGIVGFLSLVLERTDKLKLQLSVIYGVGLGLAFDEFAMWIQLEDVYKDRSTYDAIVTISLILLNIIYFDDFWKKWGNRLGLLFKRIFS
ncbi:MAG: hypothetical protein ACD_61C00019G0017 [uncultured bacterium]|nr:MAG: hypothetical protein ACD_61C00019G0017 [uncultured bacterium]